MIFIIEVVVTGRFHCICDYNIPFHGKLSYIRRRRIPQIDGFQNEMYVQ